MITPLHHTVYDVIKSDEEHFNGVIEAAVSHSLKALGNDIKQLDWSSQDAFEETKAA